MKKLVLHSLILITQLLICIFIVYGTIVIIATTELYGYYGFWVGVVLLGMWGFGFFIRAAYRQLDEIYYSYQAYRRNRPVKILYIVKSKLDR